MDIIFEGRSAIDDRPGLTGCRVASLAAGICDTRTSSGGLRRPSSRYASPLRLGLVGIRARIPRGRSAADSACDSQYRVGHPGRALRMSYP